MARLCPTLPPHAALNLGDYAELELLQTLERGLPDAFTLFHSVDWSRGTDAREQHGEIDIVVVNQGGDVLLMEVKSGQVDFQAGGLFKTYQGHSKNVTDQISLQYGALRGRLKDASLPVQLHHLLVLPDLRVNSATVQWPRERIVDSADIEHIVSRVLQLLGVGLSDGDLRERVLDFFSNKFSVAPDVSALAGRLQQQATRLAAGLAVWVPRMQVPSGVVRVVGTAGSGKTQLALRLLRDADANGRQAAYLCFNRALADHMARLAPVRTPVETFHEFALRVLRRAGHAVDFAAPQAFEAMATLCIELLEACAPDLDLIVLDEVQDMQPHWVQALLSRLRPSGQALLLEDPEQQLYRDREAFDIEGAVTVRSDENFRTPRALVRLINGLHLTQTEVLAMSPYEGKLPDPLVYETAEKVAPRTVQAIERCLQHGFALGDIAIISLRGRDSSQLQTMDRLGPWTLRHFSGQYDAGGAPIWTEGELLIDSVRRFKGQAAPAVVLTECDLPTLDTLQRRLLFVGLTRARVHLEWVISGATVGMIEEVLQG